MGSEAGVGVDHTLGDVHLGRGTEREQSEPEDPGHGGTDQCTSPLSPIPGASESLRGAPDSANCLLLES